MDLPTYGMIVLLGIVVVTAIGFLIAWHRRMRLSACIVLEVIGGGSALVGARLWHMLEQQIDTGFRGISYSQVVTQFADGGYSFYGGLLLGLAILYLVVRIMRLDSAEYTRALLCLIPLLHAFWKVGCYMGGCCYGIPYNGIGAVIYPEGGVVPAGIPLFPVQLLEADILLGMAVMMYIRGWHRWEHPVCTYLICYAIVRFLIEFLRDQDGRGILSTAQWVSIVIILFAVVHIVGNRRKNEGERVCPERES